SQGRLGGHAFLPVCCCVVGCGMRTVTTDAYAWPMTPNGCKPRAKPMASTKTECSCTGADVSNIAGLALFRAPIRLVRCRRDALTCRVVPEFASARRSGLDVQHE